MSTLKLEKAILQAHRGLENSRIQKALKALVETTKGTRAISEKEKDAQKELVDDIWSALEEESGRRGLTNFLSGYLKRNANGESKGKLLEELWEILTEGMGAKGSIERYGVSMTPREVIERIDGMVEIYRTILKAVHFS